MAADTKHRTCKYLNNIIEADHGALKRVIRPTRGLRMIRRGHCLTCKPHVKDEVRFINKLFDVFTIAA